METSVSLADIFLRLGAAVLAGGLIGFDRGTRGRIAGLRTTILICVAAAGAMIEANLMLGVTGKTDTSFTMMDALRFPLGILSGIGFIGAGAIIKRGDLVSGVTTAATMWLITVVGLILGAGFFVVGGMVTAIAFVALSLLIHLEPLMYRQHRADLCILVGSDGPSNDEIRTEIAANGYKIVTLATDQALQRHLRFHVMWRSRHGTDVVPAIVERLAARPGVVSIGWKPVDAGQHSE